MATQRKAFPYFGELLSLLYLKTTSEGKSPQVDTDSKKKNISRILAIPDSIQNEEKTFSASDIIQLLNIF